MNTSHERKRKMKDKYSIKEVADIFQIPKSTLRYWDKENLVQLERNHQNDYREYTLKQLMDVSDINFYRGINVSISNLKKMHEMNLKEFEEILSETQDAIELQLEELIKKREGILYRREKITELKRLQTSPYSFSEPDTNRICQFEVHHFSFKNAYDFAILFTPENNYQIEFGSVIADEAITGQTMWEKSDKSKGFIECLLKVSVDNPNKNNLEEHLSFVRTNYTVGTIIGRYLMTAVEDIRYDYFKIWIELHELL
jgi:DNA-binding transcriptional MerR regulator